jgi:hypothetical protein
VRVHAGSLLPRTSAGLQARAGAAGIQRPPRQELLPGSPEQVVQLLAGGLQQAGVQGLGGFRLTEGFGSIVYRGFEGSVGRCRFSGRPWVVA